MNLEELLARLKQVRKCGNGYVALCPAHDDSNPSLSITEKRGKVLWHCQAGCSQEAVQAKLIELVGNNNGTNRTPQRVLEAVYKYHDSQGNLLFEKLRYSDKQFKQRRP